MCLDPVSKVAMRRVRRKIISGGENSAGDCGKGALLGLRPYNTKEVACKRCICFSVSLFFFFSSGICKHGKGRKYSWYTVKQMPEEGHVLTVWKRSSGGFIFISLLESRRVGRVTAASFEGVPGFSRGE